MRIFFVRHGETNANINKDGAIWAHDEPLTPTGNAQIIQASNALRNTIQQPALIISSPLLRTRQTAAILGERLGLNIVIDERLREANVGEWREWSVAEVNRHLRHLPTEIRPGFRPPRGETWYETGRRVVDLVTELDDYSARSIILVSHDAPIRFGIGALVQSDPDTWSDARFPTGSLTLLESNKGTWRTIFIGTERLDSR